ncbi:hypothetical protein BASA50_007897 [Batrachochytrium salamandrivorans]|uniref:Uncharacterized protein n=1 Tax=Batrachochytrium salamandrivorans TaxID=1357716 RepID=A0ABQ8F5P4_9FUNG|nr:hypothetical protein BASA62_003007 [Batrachochytrium salamandrivorans]KAH6581681.1 hypothetical protein BASA60_002268 [Batrachochytrium salamandrivorans]KAH6592717.1 hypothetical protein BASA50_007897 [Batrachochytrium salamandrivorans]KAH6602347.1 hypothetical protein BASA61_001221 [Batrachochytrium salamandrivorans]KAH9246394.1 hypothetical protein BASA81_016058 [Batrachochytrium salamandrivorans]
MSAATIAAGVSAAAVASTASILATTAAPTAAVVKNTIFKAFPVRSLDLNLTRGRDLHEGLAAHIAALTVTFGPDSCPAKNALSSFYVNELPRIYTKTPRIKFNTVETSNGNCSLTVTLTANPSDPSSATSTDLIDLYSCTTPEDIYGGLVHRLQSATKLASTKLSNSRK